jgi:hypothetical protein
MKNTILVFLLLSVLMLSSCMKEYQCTCTYKSGAAIGDVTYVKINANTKIKAKSICRDKLVVNQLNGGKAECEL